MQHQELTASKCPSLCFNVVPTSLPGIGGMREASRDCPRRFNVAPTSLPGIEVAGDTIDPGDLQVALRAQRRRPRERAFEKRLRPRTPANQIEFSTT